MGGGSVISGIHKDSLGINSNNYTTKYEEIINIENIYKAWNKFKRGKSGKEDVNDFSLRLTDNLLDLYHDLKNKIYTHSKYQEFTIIETKKRIIHKASVRDRVMHHLLYDALYNYFDKRFIYDSYSCRKNKGVHRALLRYEYFVRKVSQNYTRQAFVLKFDIQKCFASIDHSILKAILVKHIQDKDILNLLFKIIDSHSPGIPLGNLTSQLFINIYLHELDFYCKHTLKLKYYIRYADDVVIFLDKKELEKFNIVIKNNLIDKDKNKDKNENKENNLIDKIWLFCNTNLKLNIHKVEMKTIYNGVDFLGWVHFLKYRVLRKVTKVKMLEKISEKNISSYMGMLKWGDTYKILQKNAICSIM